MSLNAASAGLVRNRITVINRSSIVGFLDEQVNITSEPDLVEAFGDNVTMEDDQTYVTVIDLINHLAQPIGYHVACDPGVAGSEDVCLLPGEEP